MASNAPIVKPRRLRQGDLIGIISPAGPVNKQELQSGQKILRSSGFKIRLAPHVYDNRGYLAGDDGARLDDMHDMFRDPEVKAIFCTRGGYGSSRLLDKIHYDLIKDNPKIIVGYSDISSLLMAIHKKTGLITFHGPMVRDLAKSNCKNWDNLVRLLSTDHLQSLNLGEGTTHVPKKVTGPLFGGNLSLICGLIGTPFLPSLDRCILFIEEKGEPLYRIDRMLTQLILSGQLKHLSGLIAGQFEDCGDAAAINEMLMDMVSGLHIPLGTGLPVGHGTVNMALPLGLIAELNTERRTLSIMETCTV